jgi:hypothetical protein
MISSFARTAAAAVAGLALLGSASVASATIYNISAQNSGIDVTLDAGQYLISWVGTADGGSFNAWNGNCLTGDCAGGWQSTFTTRDAVVPANGNFEIDLFGAGPQQASALASLQAIQSAALINHGVIQVTNFVPGGFTPLAQIPQPWIVQTDGGTIHLSAGDGTPENNFGGVSLRITAVPEPATWMIMIGGFGLVGAALRRRRNPAIA